MAILATLPPQGEELTPDEETQLAALENIIEAGFQTFIKVGNALAEIHDRKLYLAGYGTFEDYLRQRWLMSRSYAYRQIDAAAVAEAMSPIGDMSPIKTESQARAILPTYKKHGLEGALEVYRVAAANGEPTAAAITEAAGNVFGLAGRRSTKPSQTGSPSSNPSIATLAQPNTRKKLLTEEQLDLAVELLGGPLTALVAGQLHPQAAAQVFLNTLVDEPKTLQTFVLEINRYFKEATK